MPNGGIQHKFITFLRIALLLVGRKYIISSLLIVLIPLLLISCNDDNSNCPTEAVNLLNSECPAETIYSKCNVWHCVNTDNPDEEFTLNFSLNSIECEVIDCGFLRCTDTETTIITDFINITPLSEVEFSTLLNSDPGDEFNCGLVLP
jgi:hypothetical protein